MLRKLFNLFLLVFVLTGCSSNSPPEVIHEVIFSRVEHAKERAIIRPFYAEDLEILDKDPKWHGREFLYIDTFDLNNDGQKEILLYLGENTFFCGTAGCMTSIYAKYGAKWKEVFYSYTYAQMRILSNQTNNYHDIGVIGGTQHLEEGLHIFKWNGKEYEYDILDKNSKWKIGE